MSSSKAAAALAAGIMMLSFAAPAPAAAACDSARRPVPELSRNVAVRATLCVLNARRVRHRLGPLSLNDRLSTAARRHSRAMVRERFFSHDSLDGTTFLERIRATGYLTGIRSWAVGENIAYGSGSRSSPRSIGTAWMTSPPHRANILSRSFREIGIGLAGGTPMGSGGATYTTDFGRRS